MSKRTFHAYAFHVMSYRFSFDSNSELQPYFWRIGVWDFVFVIILSCVELFLVMSFRTYVFFNIFQIFIVITGLRELNAALIDIRME